MKRFVGINNNNINHYQQALQNRLIPLNRFAYSGVLFDWDYGK